MVVAPGSGIDDGSLDVYAIEASTAHRLTTLALRMRTGEFIDDESVHHCRTRAVRVKTEPTRAINLDGELVSRTPRTFTSARNALKVIVPRRSRSARYEGTVHEPMPEAAALAARRGHDLRLDKPLARRDLETHRTLIEGSSSS